MNNFEKIIAFIFRLIEIFRPKFYNRITWVVVTIGLSLMSTQFIEKIISVLIEKSFNIKITGENDVVWGFSLVVLGLTYHLITTNIYELITIKEEQSRKKEYIDHDRIIFGNADTLMTGKYLIDYLYWIECDHSIYMDKIRIIEDYCEFLKQDQNIFLSKNLNSKTQILIESSEKLLNYLATYFFVFPNNQTGSNQQLCMTPNLNIDREGDGSVEQSRKYRKHTNDLQSLINNLKENYKLFRAEIKLKLII